MSFDAGFDLDEKDAHAVMHLHRRSISEEQMRKFEADVAAIFEAFGLDLHTPATGRTPQRFLRAMFDATEGYEGDSKLLTVFETECRGGPDCLLLGRWSWGQIQTHLDALTGLLTVPPQRRAHQESQISEQLTHMLSGLSS